MNSTVTSAVSKIVSAVVVPVMTVVFALAIVLFVWGAAGLILSRDNPEKRLESQQHILWGVVGMFIMIAAYGIIRLVASTIGVSSPF